ncbi:sensor histidine kinase [Pseudobacteriovorax antillogorgiicola]|uniref:histidine kinase n=1 Tax=Pseudobacteriovorax antillogorgiicola TaxID=1513793 RepID=A0A1Y6BDT9_9BACT|nr:sensor histidine kinase [Pseudobacteriovorax antillogorgiicola]TCS57591.1 signal transduction histidine kinase [Pseudobacteriovorax antillogorgiicola]SME99519.1 Signal transduction histidine kinase [Pseudobacteriovorax antillogorgiicola]
MTARCHILLSLVCLLLADLVMAQVFDASSWTQDEPLYLDGHWYLKRGELVDPQDVDYQNLQAWDVVDIPQDSIVPVGQSFVGTFVAVIRGLQTDRELGVMIPNVYTSGRYFIKSRDRVQMVGASGRVDSDPLRSEPSYLEVNEVIVPDESELLLIIQVSNATHSRSGIRDSVTLASPAYINLYETKQNLLGGAIFGILLMFGIYHLGLFIQRPRSRENLWWGLICLAFFINHSSILAVSDINSSEYMSYISRHRTRYLTSVIIPWLFFFYIDTLYPFRYKIVLRIYSVMGFTLLCLGLYFQPQVYTAFVYALQTYISLTVFHVVSRLWVATKNREAGGMASLISFVILTLGVVNDILYNERVINSAYLTPYFSICFVITQSLLQGYFHALSLKQVTYLSRDLQEQVDEKTKSLDDTNQELKAQVQETKQLVKVISHDIANPLSIIVGAAELLSRRVPEDDSAGQRLILKIIRAVETQERILNHIKHMQAIKDGKEAMDLVPINLREALDDMCFAFEERLAKKEISLDVTFSDEQDFIAMAEKVSLVNEVLNNLMSNAIKFSPHGGKIVIVVSREKDHGIAIRLIDQGIGIPDKLLTDLFEVGKPTSRQGTEGEKGTGFGMTIVKSYVEKYGGQLRIDSKDEEDHPNDHGTTMTVVLKEAS